MDNGTVADDRFVFGESSELTAGAQGAPGSRTFYVIAGESGRWVRVWMEKEQLGALAAAIDRLLEALAEQGLKEAEEPGRMDPPEPPGDPASEFRVGTLALGHDPGRDRVVLLVHRANQPEDAPPSLQVSASKAQMRALSRRIKDVYAGGRPICALCGGPMDPQGHVCPRSNGHRAGQQGTAV